MVTITDLSDEVIIIILEDKNISIDDIVSLKSTCNRLQQIMLSNKFWEKKYYQRCFTATKKYNTKKRKKSFDHLNFKEQIKAGNQYIKKLQNYVLLMSDDNLSETNKEELEVLLYSIVKKSMIYYFVWDELNRTIFAEIPWKYGSNLTNNYYFGLIFDCLIQYRFLYKQVKFLNKPREKQLSERQLIIMAQYFLPRVSYSVIDTWLDGIVQEILLRVKNKHLTHSISSIPLEKFSFWRDNNIYNNFWELTEEKQIMSILEQYIFSYLELSKLYQLLIISDSEVKYLNSISESFQRCVLFITYQIVARRLGIPIINNENNMSRLNTDRILIIWEYSTEEEEEEKEESFSFSNGSWDSPEYFNISSSNIVRRTYYRQFSWHYNQWQNRVISYIIFMVNKNSILFYRFKCLVPTRTKILNVCYFCDDRYLLNNINYEWRLNMLIDILRSLANDSDIKYDIYCKEITKIIKVRSDDRIRQQLKFGNVETVDKVKFAIGMIVSHSKKYNEEKKHYGVIIGWHCEHNSTFVRTFINWFRSSYTSYLCIRETEDIIDQPCYMILSENHKMCYVQQDLISICPPKWINNFEIGRYFSKFESTHYVPNESLAELYPTDGARISEILSSQLYTS